MRGDTEAIVPIQVGGSSRQPHLRGPVITGAIPGPQLRMLDEPRVGLVADAIADLLSAPL